jgi:hypothetical protein
MIDMSCAWLSDEQRRTLNRQRILARSVLALCAALIIALLAINA